MAQPLKRSAFRTTLSCSLRDPVTESDAHALAALTVRSVERDEALCNLSEILAHRLRGLVTSIEGFADLLTGTLPTREQREMLLRIFEGTTGIERILADLQHYSQPTAPVPTLIQAEALLNGALDALNDDDYAWLAVDQQAPEAQVSADPQLVRQALLILIQNAFDARPAGTLVRICAGLDETTGQLRFDVINQGRIMLEAPENQVFVPFFTTKAHNLGVGLCIARRIAEAHSGLLFLASTDGKHGTRFSLLLPLAPFAATSSMPITAGP